MKMICGKHPFLSWQDQIFQPVFLSSIPFTW